MGGYCVLHTNVIRATPESKFMSAVRCGTTMCCVVVTRMARIICVRTWTVEHAS